jgi:DNA-binding transcriptional MerR regulator
VAIYSDDPPLPFIHLYARNLTPTTDRVNLRCRARRRSPAFVLSGRVDSPVAGGWRLKAMPRLLTIGEFSRLTHVSVKALRHYHDVGLLAPADIDRGSGYRFYAAAQAPTAQLIRRFREMDMPLEQIKAVLCASDADERDRLIVAHLRSMQRQLEQTQATVASLRTLLEGGGPTPSVTLVTIEPVHALMVHRTVAWDDTEGWLHDTLGDLRRRLEEGDATRSGPDGALYSGEFFENHLGEVTAFIPIGAASSDSDVLAGGPVALTVHEGPFSELDRVYAALGAFVAERGIGAGTPIRESYLVSMLDTTESDSLVTEVCWPTVPTPG